MTSKHTHRDRITHAVSITALIEAEAYCAPMVQGRARRADVDQLLVVSTTRDSRATDQDPYRHEVTRGQLHSLIKGLVMDHGHTISFVVGMTPAGFPFALELTPVLRGLSGRDAVRVLRWWPSAVWCFAMLMGGRWVQDQSHSLSTLLTAHVTTGVLMVPPGG